SLELGDARLRLGQGARACCGVILACCPRRGGARLARFALGKPHFIAGRRGLRRLGLGFNAPARLALAGGSLGACRYGREAAAVGAAGASAAGASAAGFGSSAGAAGASAAGFCASTGAAGFAAIGGSGVVAIACWRLRYSGGSSRKVYSRTKRPLGHCNSISK